MQGTNTGRAAGGPVAPFGAYNVTEHGDPELLSFGGRQVLLMGSKGGMVTPLMNKSAGGGSGAGGPMRVEIVNAGPPVKADRAEYQSAPDGDGLLRVFLSAVADDVMSGGSVWQATKARGGLRDAV